MRDLHSVDEAVAGRLVEDPWAASYRVIRAADNLLEGAPEVGLSPTFESAILALAQLYRGMALGQLYLNYERAPLAIVLAG